MSRGPRRIASLCACTLLAACAQTTRLYTPPPIPAGTARVRFSTDGVVHLVPARACLDFDAPRAGLGPVASGGFFSTAMNNRNLGIPGAQEASQSGLTSTELRVVAGEPLLVSYVNSSSTYSYPTTTTYTCRSYFIFTPEEGVDYQAVSRSTPGARRCGQVIYAIGNAAGPWASVVKLENAYVPARCDSKKTPPPSGEEASPSG